MQRNVVSTLKAPAAIGPYSQAISAAGFVFCSGQIPLHPDTGELVGGDDIEAQTRQVLHNLKAVLEAAGSGVEKIVKTTIYLTDLGDFARVNSVYATLFEGITPPARVTIEVAGLPRGAKVEIDALALA